MTLTSSLSYSSFQPLFSEVMLTIYLSSNFDPNGSLSRTLTSSNTMQKQIQRQGHIQYIRQMPVQNTLQSGRINGT